MELELLFKRTIVAKGLLLLLIILWGGYVQATNNSVKIDASVTDLGGLLFGIFSLAYLGNSLLLYRFHNLGKRFFLPLVAIFIILGFLTELMNETQFPKDLYYLFIFYIISPLFFMGQGVIIFVLYETELKNKF